MDKKELKFLIDVGVGKKLKTGFLDRDIMQKV